MGQQWSGRPIIHVDQLLDGLSTLSIGHDKPVGYDLFSVQKGPCFIHPLTTKCEHLLRSCALAVGLTITVNFQCDGVIGKLKQFVAMGIRVFQVDTTFKKPCALNIYPGIGVADNCGTGCCQKLFTEEIGRYTLQWNYATKILLINLVVPTRFCA